MFNWDDGMAFAEMLAAAAVFSFIVFGIARR